MDTGTMSLSTQIYPDHKELSTVFYSPKKGG